MKNTQPTIESLRKSGWKVAVIHGSRRHDQKRYTHIIVTSPEKKHAEGIAFVHEGDQYNRKIGNKIALGRALKNLENNILIRAFFHPANDL